MAEENQNGSPAANEAEVPNPNAGTAHTPEISAENVSSTDSPEASTLPSANKPDTNPTGPDEKPKAPKREKAEGAAAAKGDRPKKEKAPAVEDKPFAEFVTQDLLPNLKKTLDTVGISDVDLKFEKAKLPIRGMDEVGECSQIIGSLNDGRRQFIIGFLKDDIQSQKFFCCSENGGHPSTLESFMIDERRVTLDLLVFYTVQRLNGQKWLVRN